MIIEVSLTSSFIFTAASSATLKMYLKSKSGCIQKGKKREKEMSKIKDFFNKHKETFN